MVTDQQLTDRALYRIDPITGTTEDGVFPGQDHKCARVAARINSEAAYVHAERVIRTSRAYAEARARAKVDGLDGWNVRVRLSEIFGDRYLHHVHGVRRNGSTNHPTGNPPGSLPPTEANFVDGSIVALFKDDPNGIERLHTMYPDPKKTGE
jgi:hypothetical protein